MKVAIDKYLDHLPLNRQARIMGRHGLEVTSQTLWDQVHALGERLRVVWEDLFARVIREPVIGLDQTSWKRLENKSAKPWQMWCLTAPGLVYHRICDDKSTRTFTALVGDYEGVIVCDALSTHHAGARAGPGIVLAGCRVGGGLSAPAPHRSGRAGFPHPVPHVSVSLVQAYP